MSTEDFEFTVRLTDTMNWNMTEEDFKFSMNIEPEGCFVLFSGSERVGIITSASYGKLGWLGNLIVDEHCRGKGAGSLLAKKVIEYLTGKGVQTIGLYAYMDKIPFYTRLGFKNDREYITLSGRNSCNDANTSASVREARKTEISKVIELDAHCFGSSRAKVLRSILQSSDSLCFLVAENDEPMGYAIASVYGDTAEVGPFGCLRTRKDSSAHLLRTLLARLGSVEVSMCTPEDEAIVLRAASRCGLTRGFHLARMFHGPAISSECAYAAESLERG
jgi:predicted N-acetyltransferase YhbS